MYLEYCSPRRICVKTYEEKVFIFNVHGARWVSGNEGIYSYIFSGSFTKQ